MAALSRLLNVSRLCAVHLHACTRAARRVAVEHWVPRHAARCRRMLTTFLNPLFHCLQVVPSTAIGFTIYDLLKLALHLPTNL